MGDGGKISRVAMGQGKCGERKKRAHGALSLVSLKLPSQGKHKKKSEAKSQADHYSSRKLIPTDKEAIGIGSGGYLTRLIQRFTGKAGARTQRGLIPTSNMQFYFLIYFYFSITIYPFYVLSHPAITTLLSMSSLFFFFSILPPSPITSLHQSCLPPLSVPILLGVEFNDQTELPSSMQL